MQFISAWKFVLNLLFFKLELSSGCDKSRCLHKISGISRASKVDSHVIYIFHRFDSMENLHLHIVLHDENASGPIQAAGPFLRQFRHVATQPIALTKFCRARPIFKSLIVGVQIPLSNQSTDALLRHDFDNVLNKDLIRVRTI